MVSPFIYWCLSHDALFSAEFDDYSIVCNKLFVSGDFIVALCLFLLECALGIEVEILSLRGTKQSNRKIASFLAMTDCNEKPDPCGNAKIVLLNYFLVKLTNKIVFIKFYDLINTNS
jgi:hypothetical protein